MMKCVFPYNHKPSLSKTSNKQTDGSILIFLENRVCHFMQIVSETISIKCQILYLEASKKVLPNIFSFFFPSMLSVSIPTVSLNLPQQVSVFVKDQSVVQWGLHHVPS